LPFFDRASALQRQSYEKRAVSSRNVISGPYFAASRARRYDPLRVQTRQAISGACDVVLAGGVESMLNIEYYTTDMRWGRRSGTAQFYDRLDRGREQSQPVHRFGYISGMIETAENLAKDYKITREEADAFAAESHRRAAAAWDEGRFSDEVVSVPVPQRKGDPVLVARRGHPSRKHTRDPRQAQGDHEGGNGDRRQLGASE
jgi:hypothetical protein